LPILAPSPSPSRIDGPHRSCFIAEPAKLFVNPDQSQPGARRLAVVVTQKPVELILPGANLRHRLMLTLVAELRRFRPQHLPDNLLRYPDKYAPISLACRRSSYAMRLLPASAIHGSRSSASFLRIMEGKQAIKLHASTSRGTPASMAAIMTVIRAAAKPSRGGGDPIPEHEARGRDLPTRDDPLQPEQPHTGAEQEKVRAKQKGANTQNVRRSEEQGRKIQRSDENHPDR
jgi:hypothetical protein